MALIYNQAWNIKNYRYVGDVSWAKMHFSMVPQVSWYTLHNIRVLRTLISQALHKTMYGLM